MMSEDVIIRKANKKDFEQIHKLVMQVHKIHVENRSDVYKNSDPLDINTFEEEISNSNNIYLVAECNNEIIGICFAELKNVLNNKIMKDRKIINISNICVKKEKQKKGIGKKLYNEILNLAEKLGVNSIELMVWGFNNNAINFYKSIGMQVKNIRFEKRMI